MVEPHWPFVEDKPAISYEDYTAEEHYKCGSVYESEGKLNWAAIEFERALRRDTEGRVLAKACFALGNAYRRKGDLATRRLRPDHYWDQAESWYDRCRKESPVHLGAATNLADLCAERGHRLENAVDLCLEVIKRIRP